MDNLKTKTSQDCIEQLSKLLTFYFEKTKLFKNIYKLLYKKFKTL